MAQPLTRRRLLEAVTAGGLLWSVSRTAFAATPFPVRFRKPLPYEELYRYADPEQDHFETEKRAAEITRVLGRLMEERRLPLSDNFRGGSPMPKRYRNIAPDVLAAEFDADSGSFSEGLARWLESLGSMREARFFPLANDIVRFEIAGSRNQELQYRVGHWRMVWSGDRLSSFTPLDETLMTASRPWFEDVTGALFGGDDGFRRQLSRGVPYWRARLDSASGIDVYGNNGIAAGDIDNDGRDEIYVCQPGGLPNRLYRQQNGVMEDITARSGAGVLDDTASALFADFRNSGRQDLVVLTTKGPLLFLNQGDGTFVFLEKAFRSTASPAGTFTGMAAADFDRDGRLDLYLCTYVYFHSEDQYRYPVPYHDARTGPANFLFRNRLEPDGYFEDVTAVCGMGENNDRYSFAPAWCDYDGDGWPDLYVANDFGRNNLYRNEGGKFRDAAERAGVEDLGPGMSAAWFDYDGDGLPDLYVSNMWTAPGQRLADDPAFGPVSDDGLREAYRRHAKGNSLYRNRGDGTFEETGAEQGVEMGRWAWSADGFDFDNDGSPEMYVTAGMLTNASEKDLGSFFWRQVVAHSPPEKASAAGYENGWNAINQLIREDYSWNGREPNVFYARRGGRYYDFSGVSGLDVADDSRAFAVTDLDGDGNPDLLVKSRLGPQVRAFRNACGLSRRALAIELRGVKSNRDAIGARVHLEHAGGRVTRFLSAGSGYLSQHTKRLHFGLGESAAARTVHVRWPSGIEQRFDDLEAGFVHQITEGSAEVRRRRFEERREPPEAAVTADNRAELDATWLLEPAPLPDRRRGRGFLLLTAGETETPRDVPCETVDLRREPPEVAARYAIFRRYLFDFRTGLTVPLLILADERGFAHKVYARIPSTAALRRDLAAMRDQDRIALALPFPGRYYHPPGRNYFQLGAGFFWSGYPEEALRYLREALKREPENFLALLAAGQIHLETGAHEQARPHLLRAAGMNPASPQVWNNLGGVEMATGDYGAALRHFEKALALDPDLGFALANAGQAQARLGNAEAAEKLFRRALKLDARDADSANQLGLLLARNGRGAEAKRYFQQAIEAQRNHAGAINNLGVLYMQMREPGEAIAAFRYGMEVAPDDETLYLNLARVYATLGDTEKARDVLGRLQGRRPDSALARKALEELGSR